MAGYKYRSCPIMAFAKSGFGVYLYPKILIPPPWGGGKGVGNARHSGFVKILDALLLFQPGQPPADADPDASVRVSAEKDPGLLCDLIP